MRRTSVQVLIFVTLLVGAVACAQPPLSSPLVSPYYGWSGLSDSDIHHPYWQVARFNTCKAMAGPVTITIVEREDAPAPQDVAHIIASVSVGGSNVGSTPTPLTGPGQAWSSESLPAGTCFNVTIIDENADWWDVVDGLQVARFRYRIDW